MKYLAGLTSIAMLAGSAAAPAAPPADAAAGAVVFKKCAACHSVDPSGRNGLGPNLRGVVNRKAAEAPGFNYSPAMKASALVWNDRNLASFLAAPRQALPGTKMIFIGLSNAQDQANVIAFLRQNGTAKK
ncbi:cytochrome c family protein [Sphingomonas sp. QA11]|uniref:c-type cytochrome n=1 Tax=Sphingomonas sp. QA11 TaxID=2950605 RepID=UPI00234B02B3|nr:cytochrome c family protein [Sphingomonas sp. QA11]WCM27282.1 cytochrome c family protein [Sphingomonas sp. QA11]